VQFKYHPSGCRNHYTWVWGNQLSADVVADGSVQVRFDAGSVLRMAIFGARGGRGCSSRYGRSLAEQGDIHHARERGGPCGSLGGHFFSPRQGSRAGTALALLAGAGARACDGQCPSSQGACAYCTSPRASLGSRRRGASVWFSGPVCRWNVCRGRESGGRLFGIHCRGQRPGSGCMADVDAAQALHALGARRAAHHLVCGGSVFI